MYHLRRKEKEVVDSEELIIPLRKAAHITLAFCGNNEPYLVTLNHGYDEEENCIYFHCASEGKKIDLLNMNPTVWGQALIDNGYQQGSCDHLYHTTQFKGRVSFIDDLNKKEHALRLMIRKLDENPKFIFKNQLKPDSIRKVLIGRIEIYYMSGKKADNIIISV
jgi:nitroimidazol reductase NimA-like FMN-containing flavoprotein (pyridoxamine 5'-phosphate oxidase superfamily)